MKKITSLTNDPAQSVSLVLDDGSRVAVDLVYIPNQQGWYYSITYGTFEVLNRRLVTSPNIIRGVRDLIPFGICCTTVDGYEPVYQDDFTSGRVSLYQLNAQDVIDTETLITVTLPTFAGYPLE